jgi:hypothetical protein
MDGREDVRAEFQDPHNAFQNGQIHWIVALYLCAITVIDSENQFIGPGTLAFSQNSNCALVEDGSFFLMFQYFALMLFRSNAKTSSNRHRPDA